MDQRRHYHLLTLLPPLPPPGTSLPVTMAEALGRLRLQGERDLERLADALESEAGLRDALEEWVLNPRGSRAVPAALPFSLAALFEEERIAGTGEDAWIDAVWQAWDATRARGRGGQGLPAAMEAEEYLEQARLEFLDREAPRYSFAVDELAAYSPEAPLPGAAAGSGPGEGAGAPERGGGAVSAAGRIVAVYGNLVTAEIDGPIRQNAVTYCLRSDGVRLMSEIIRVRGRLADMRVYEREFPQLQDPRTGRTLMERTIIICNTSSMPVAARESSVYTAVTMGEYYRQLGLDVLLLADSTSRWAQALREMSGRLEEIPGEEAFPAFLGLSYARRLGPYLPRAGARGSSR